MKPVFILFATIVLGALQAAKSQDFKRNLRNFEPKAKTVIMKVYGECGMCKHRIENSMKVDGIKTASWDANTKLLTVQYILTADIKDTNSIGKLIAAAGHDTEVLKAKDSLYDSLPGCCKYQRQENYHQGNSTHAVK